MQHPLKKRPKRRPRPRLLLILTGVGVALAAAALFFLLPAIKARFPAETALPLETGPESRTLYLGDSSQLDSIVISQQEGDRYTLRMQDGHLVLERGGQWLTVSDYQEEAILKAVTQLVMPGVVTEDEAEVAGQLEGIYRELGAQGHSFTPIVSFGANAADPHHEPDDTPLASGDVVLFDVGCRKGEYCSDMTRTFVFGEPSEKLREVHDTVRRANEAARKLVAPGVRFCDIDAAARSIIEEAGYGSYFTHRLGHQIGLDVHEPGDVSAAHDAPVQAGMVFSIEPGIYLPGEFGVRIEDLVLVTEDGCEVLNSYPRELVSIG